MTIILASYLLEKWAFIPQMLKINFLREVFVKSE